MKPILIVVLSFLALTLQTSAQASDESLQCVFENPRQGSQICSFSLILMKLNPTTQKPEPVVTREKSIWGNPIFAFNKIVNWPNDGDDGGYYFKTTSDGAHHRILLASHCNVDQVLNLYNLPRKDVEGYMDEGIERYVFSAVARCEAAKIRYLENKKRRP